MLPWLKLHYHLITCQKCSFELNKVQSLIDFDLLQTISDLQAEGDTASSSSPLMSASLVEIEGLRGELELMRDETATLREEVRGREMAASELEEHWQREQATLQRSLTDAEQHLERERQVSLKNHYPIPGFLSLYQLEKTDRDGFSTFYSFARAIAALLFYPVDDLCSSWPAINVSGDTLN